VRPALHDTRPHVARHGAQEGALIDEVDELAWRVGEEIGFDDVLAPGAERLLRRNNGGRGEVDSGGVPAGFAENR
jgi:hypothetical protein